jgi:RimJ/RimL family protein N-acetyltransferase
VARDRLSHHVSASADERWPGMPRFGFGRFVVRPLAAGDGPALLDAVTRSRPWLLGQSPLAAVTTPAEAEAMVRASQADSLVDDAYVFGCFEPDGRLVAGCGCWPTDGPRARTAEIGGWMRRFVRHRDFSTELGRQWVDFAFRTWQLRRIVAYCDADNPRGVALAERIGLRAEGRLRAMWRPLRGEAVDVIAFGLLAEDTRPLPRDRP